MVTEIVVPSVVAGCGKRKATQMSDMAISKRQEKLVSRYKTISDAVAFVVRGEQLYVNAEEKANNQNKYDPEFKHKILSELVEFELQRIGDIKAAYREILKSYDFCFTASCSVDGYCDEEKKQICIKSSLENHKLVVVLRQQMAHAIVGCKHNNDSVWRHTCHEIGGVKNFDDRKISFKYKLVCPRCDADNYDNKHTNRKSRLVCEKCQGNLVLVAKK